MRWNGFVLITRCKNSSGHRKKIDKILIRVKVVKIESLYEKSFGSAHARQPSIWLRFSIDEKEMREENCSRYENEFSSMQLEVKIWAEEILHFFFY